MRDPSGHSLPRDNQGRWQQVQLSQGRWRREDAAGAIGSAGWWESVTVTWSPAPAPDRRPDVLPRALAAATDMIAPVLADVAITSIRRLIQRGHRGLPVVSVLRRQLVSDPAAGVRVQPRPAARRCGRGRRRPQAPAGMNRPSGALGPLLGWIPRPGPRYGAGWL